jgi:hypothetical protein
MKDEPENTRPRPEGESRPQTEAEYRSLTRGLAQDVATLYGESVVKAAGPATVAGVIVGAARLKAVLTKKDEPSKLWTPPGSDK